jgi:hypothetical protein
VPEEGQTTGSTRANGDICICTRHDTTLCAIDASAREGYVLHPPDSPAALAYRAVQVATPTLPIVSYDLQRPA